ncbi:hypothetical protein RBH26_15650 [Natronolimnohabitans sp. A-GB9]|nr:hypothetical protein [Natronolimnohabitans sp. A-GB9]MDQ2051912.1 hypothetical protein [Natronolimnohabitans sp. A-GB9]
MGHYGINRDGQTLADRLAEPEIGPEDVGLSAMTDDESIAKFSKRGGSV